MLTAADISDGWDEQKIPGLADHVRAYSYRNAMIGSTLVARFAGM
jgi:hypothetical protein